MKCESCGFQIMKGDNFCSSCGAANPRNLPPKNEPMNIYEYQDRMKKAVQESLRKPACRDCVDKAVPGAADSSPSPLAVMNAARCESCAFIIADPIEKLVLERAHSLVGRHAEEVVRAWRRLKAPAADVKDSMRNWDAYLLAFDQGTGKHPQEVRRERGKEHLAAFEELGKTLRALDEAMPKEAVLAAEPKT